ncbi:MAG: hypothetical protein CML06_20230 [Pseudomonadales bacterium]|nr:hypothetical protein [Pseudomonadales bacterium]
MPTQYSLVLVSVLALLCTGCWPGESDSLRGSVATEGVSAAVQANLPLGSDRAQVAASFYQDGVKQALVGGDIVRAYSATHSVILRSLENLSGDYLATLPGASINAPVSFEVEFDPQAAREDRWYPVDELLVNPGPGELVGYGVEVSFPPAIQLDAPVGNEIYTSRDQDIVLTWVPDAATEQLRITTVQTCYSGDQSVKWALSRIIGTSDPGTYSVRVGDLVPANGLINALTDIVSQLSVIIVSAVVEATTFGLVGHDDIDIDRFTLESCDISLTLFREISNELSGDIAGGYAIGSTSDTVTVVYQP